MKAKKLLALTLALIMALSCMSITAFADGATAVENSTSAVEWTAGEYVVNSNVTISGGITVSGNVTLTINDNYTLTVNGTDAASISDNGANGITVASNATLTVNGTGSLISKGGNGANGNSGSVTSTSGATAGNGENGSNGGIGIYILGALSNNGAAITATGGNGGNGGDGGNHNGMVGNGGNGGNGGDGGNGFYGKLIMNNGFFAANAGTAGTGGFQGLTTTPYNGSNGIAGQSGRNGLQAEFTTGSNISSGLFNINVGNYVENGYVCATNTDAATKDTYGYKVVSGCYLDLEEGDDYLDTKSGIDQTYTATVNTPKTDKTKVQVSWKLEDITVTVTNNKIWDPDTLTWIADTSKTNGAAASDPTAEFNFVNLSSKDVYAKLTFAKDSSITTEPTKAFTDNEETAGAGDGIIKLGNKATSSATDNTGKIKLALTVTDSDFDAITSDTTGTYGTYTVTINDKDMATKKTVKATIGGNQVDRTGVQLWENGPFFAEFNVGATINSYSGVTTYDAANVGEYYKWGTTSKSGEYSTATTNIAGTDADTAKAVWGENWQMPTSTQLSDLIDTNKTTWEWCDGTTKQYVSGCTLAGYKVSGKGDYAENSIFLPVAGYIGDADPYGSGIICYCWSSTPYRDSMAWSLSAFSGNKYVSYTGRYYACNVRAIIAED